MKGYLVLSTLKFGSMAGTKAIFFLSDRLLRDTQDKYEDIILCRCLWPKKRGNAEPYEYYFAEKGWGNADDIPSRYHRRKFAPYIEAAILLY
jgi:hypothetical protein